MNSRPMILTAGILILACHAALATTLLVATNGTDTNPGTEEKPFATLERARDEIRRMRAGGRLPVGGITVEVRGGVYELARPVEWTDKDSGTDNSPIVYRVRPGEVARIVGGRSVRGWQPVTEPAILQRLDPAAHGKVFQADLKALGITDLQGIGNAGVYQSDPGLELFFQDQPMTLARYPNSGYLHIADVLDATGVVKSGQARTPEGRFVCDDSRSARWVGEKGIWLHGFWVWDWADQRIPLGIVTPSNHTLSLASQPGRSYEIRKGQWFYAENALSELDSPGEWYVDRETSILYFWPPAALSSSQAVVSMVRDPFQLNNVSNACFRGLLIEAGRGSAMVIKGGSNVRVIGCTIRNMGSWAVKVYGGTRHGVVGCDIYQTGQGGLHLEGGDRKNLRRAGDRVELIQPDAPHFHRFLLARHNGVEVAVVNQRVRVAVFAAFGRPGTAPLVRRFAQDEMLIKAHPIPRERQDQRRAPAADRVPDVVEAPVRQASEVKLGVGVAEFRFDGRGPGRAVVAALGDASRSSWFRAGRGTRSPLWVASPSAARRACRSAIRRGW